MPLIFLPGQFSQRADFYTQLAQLTSAGLGIVQSLQQLERHPPARHYRPAIAQIISDVSQGCTLADSFEHLGRWLPEFDLALLRAGEQSGRIDACFRLLAQYYTHRAGIARKLLADLAYPAFVFHFAVFLFPFISFFQTGDWVRYLAQTFGLLLPLYTVIAFGIYAAQSRHGENWRGFIEALLDSVPVVGKCRRELALSRLCSALEALLSAGVMIIEAWQLAAAASGSPALRRIVANWQPELRAGRTPAELVLEARRFPQMFSSQYASAEISGKLDETLRRLAVYFLEVGTNKMRAIAQWTPRLVYLVVALAIAYKVIGFYAGYFKMVGEAGGF